MSSFKIYGLAGEKKLKGSIAVSGMKNAALPIMAAATLVPGESRFSNMPRISDVQAMSKLIEDLGGYTTQSENTLSIRAHELTSTVLNPERAKSMRASVLLTGPVLARMGSVTFPHPGGCVLGTRPIDVFVTGFKKLGATYSESDTSYTLSAPNGLQGGEIFFRLVSVTATETFMMAATCARAPVTLMNCAMEPEVVATASFLISCGANIEGVGTPTMTIRPSTLHEPEKITTIIPDRIEAASFLILGALAGEEITVTHIEPSDVTAVTEALRSMNVPIKIADSTITVSAPRKLLPFELRTHEYPGFPTDAQAPMTVLMTQAEGESSVLETIFDGRLNYTADLVRMGAQIQLWNPHKATIRGPTTLKARDIDGPDIRAGLAFVLAGIIASGESHVGNAHLVDRGYEMIEERLSALGVQIQRTE